MYPYRRIMVQDSGNICQCDITSHPTKNLWAGPTPCALSPGSWTTKHLWAGPTRRKKSCLLAPCACLLLVACACLRLIIFSFYFEDSGPDEHGPCYNVRKSLIFCFYNSIFINIVMSAKFIVAAVDFFIPFFN